MAQMTTFLFELFSTSFLNTKITNLERFGACSEAWKKNLKGSMGAYLNYRKVSRVKTVNDDDVQII